MVRYDRVCGSRSIHLWQRPTFRPARCAIVHDRPDDREGVPAYGTVQVRVTRRVLQPAQPRQLQCAWVYLWCSGVWSGDECETRTDGPVGGQIGVLGEEL